MQLPLYGNLARRETLRANRQATTTIITTMEIYLQILMAVRIKNKRKLVLPEALQNNSREGNRSSLNNSKPQEKLRRSKFPANSKLLSLCPLDPRSRQQILVFLPSTPLTKTEILKLFPKPRFTLTKKYRPPPDQRVAKIMTPLDLRP